EKHPQTPILLTSHAGYGDAKTNPQTKRITEKLNQLLAQEEEQFKALGIQSVHLLPSSHIGLNEDDFVDGVHPTDAGMLKYSRAYEKIIRTIQSNDPHL
ncbi:SGNH/GDSL hydrolase family protein, partial [uncultured Algoriphagus sp.]|uniref:SGNH/GDSL hydrolase family protein n=1 Tax=uncultured Algoriphagus sp. TaxID=417365 RepID=UPI00259151B9